MMNGFHHVKLPVSEVAVSRDWYRRVLGFRVDMEFVEDNVLMGIALIDSTGTVCLALRRDPDRVAAWSGFDPIAIAVTTRDQVQAWRQRLDDLDQPHGGVITGHNGGSVLVGLHDPDGIEIRLYAE
jgi:catechol 2,3-dioxygenase-like lactoylglutathione lyase family enzyme